MASRCGDQSRRATGEKYSVNVGVAITAWTIRAALVCYAVVLLWYASRRNVRLSPTAARLIWTCGLVLYLAHVAAAFHFYHDWSHTAALAHTADETERVVGWRFGGGLYFNYLFTALWCGDVLWWWLRPAIYQSRPIRVSAALHGFMAFIVVNAAIVFKNGPTRWISLGVVVVAVMTWLGCRCRIR